MNAKDLIDAFLEGSDVNDLLGKSLKPRTLAQKQGARKSSRTKSRRQYTELHEGAAGGYLTHHYYERKPNRK